MAAWVLGVDRELLGVDREQSGVRCNLFGKFVRAYAWQLNLAGEKHACHCS